jgi:hypothetical protein
MIEVTLNPDILPTKEEWILVCKLIKQQRELTDKEMLEVYKNLFNKKNEFRENLKRRSYFDFARAILQKASEK